MDNDEQTILKPLQSNGASSDKNHAGRRLAMKSDTLSFMVMNKHIFDI